MRRALLMVDEPTSGLDVTISVQILDLMREAVRTLRSGLLVVSRDLGIVAHYCERVAVMREGMIVEEAPVARFFKAAQHDYSRHLLRAAMAARDADLVQDQPLAMPARRRAGGRAGAGRGPGAGGRTAGQALPGQGRPRAHRGERRVAAIRRGEALGLVGESGSGKTTVGRCILRLLEPTSGTVRFAGRDVSILPQAQFRRLRSRIQMVFQDPFDSIDPRQRISDALEEPLRLTTSMTAGERRSRVAELLGLVGLDRAKAGLYPHQMSAGELQRVGIARAIATEPDLVVFDEPTSALDVSVRAEILNLLRDLQRRLGMAYLFISHDLTAVRRSVDRVAILYLGKLVETGETEDLFEDPLHPYSRALLSSVLYPDPNQQRATIALSGEIPSPIDLPPGCALHRRCPLATDACSRIEPPFEIKQPGRRLACTNRPGADRDAARALATGEPGMNREDLAFESATSLGRRIRAREVSSVAADRDISRRGSSG